MSSWGSDRDAGDGVEEGAAERERRADGELDERGLCAVRRDLADLSGEGEADVGVAVAVERDALGRFERLGIERGEDLELRGIWWMSPQPGGEQDENG